VTDVRAGTGPPLMLAFNSIALRPLHLMAFQDQDAYPDASNRILPDMMSLMHASPEKHQTFIGDVSMTAMCRHVYPSSIACP